MFKNDNGVMVCVDSTSFVNVAFGAVNCEDVDADGDQDILINGQTSGANAGALYLNNGNSNLTPAPFQPEGMSGIARFLDFNHDGLPDILIIGANQSFSDTARLYQNTGG